MRRLLPGSLLGRALFVMLVGLVAFHLLSLLFYSVHLSNELGLGNERNFAERVADLWRQVVSAPAVDRERVAHSASGTVVQVHMSSRSLVASSPPQDERARRMTEYIRSAAPALMEDDLLVGYAERSSIDSAAAASNDQILDQPLLISLKLPGSSWLDIAVTRFGQPRWSFWGLAVSTSVMALGIILLVGMSVRFVIAPLATLAHAADRLGIDIDALAIPERGPTEVQKAAHAFNRMQDRIKHLIADRTQTLAAISHDLRTPLTRLRLRAEFVEDDEQRRKMLADLADMDSLVSSILALARGDTKEEEWQIVDVTAMLFTICNNLRDSGMPVDFTSDTKTPLRCRPFALKRGLTNLIENGVKYGGRAEVRLHDFTDHIVIEIDDEGPGIPPDEREKVFSPFYRLDPSRSRETGGAGLGLTVARTIIGAHGGAILLQDRQPRGLRVSVDLPRGEAL